ncbi:MAG: hypothetical protein WC763_07045 [Candidatus Paceibacterota bacterium]|jgi:hypothetical protein
MINLLYEGVDKQLKGKDERMALLERLLIEARQDLQAYHDRNDNRSVLTERILGRIDSAMKEEK